MTVEIMFTTEFSNALQSCLLSCTSLLELILVFICFISVYRLSFPPKFSKAVNAVTCLSIFSICSNKLTPYFPLETVPPGAFHLFTLIQTHCSLFESYLQPLWDGSVFLFLFSPSSDFISWFARMDSPADS